MAERFSTQAEAMASAAQRRVGQPRGPRATSNPFSVTRAWTEAQASSATVARAKAAADHTACSPARPPIATTVAPAVTIPLTAAVRWSQRLDARDSHTNRCPSGISSAGPATGGTVTRARQPISRATTPTATAPARVTTTQTVTDPASRQSVRSRFARTMEA
ncbi:hypothetical protein O1157_12450 [Streptomyces albogriseolus]